MKTKEKPKVDLRNKKAGFEYEFLEVFTAGMVLSGTEIKSIRAGKIGFVDSYCSFIGGELWVHNLHISEYKQGNHYNHDPKRDRKLLLTKRELRKLGDKIKGTGITIVPTRIWVNENGFAKMDIALAKGKKLYDKRESIKEKDTRRAMARRDE